MRVLANLLLFVALSLIIRSTFGQTKMTLHDQPDFKIGVPTTSLGNSNLTSNLGNAEHYLDANYQGLGAYYQGLDAKYQGSCCRNSAKCNGCCRRCGGFYAGVAAVFAKPHFKEAFEISETNTQTGLQTLQPFQYDYEITPRIFAGFTTADGMGLRGTYWQFDQSGDPTQNTSDGITIFGAHAVSIIFPATILASMPGTTLVTQNSLETQIANLYATHNGELGSIEMTVGFGLRYAKLIQSIDATVLDQAGGVGAILNWERDYEGVGPAVFVDAKKRIGCSRFSVFTQGGGSLLFGQKQLERFVLNDQSPQPAAPFLRLQDADEVVGVGELGLGIEWSARTRNGRRFSVRSVYEGQLWAEAGAPTLGFLGFEGFGIQVELNQ